MKTAERIWTNLVYTTQIWRNVVVLSADSLFTSPARRIILEKVYDVICCTIHIRHSTFDIHSRSIADVLQSIDI